MKYLLDTDVVSQTTKARPDRKALEWMRAQHEQELAISAMTVQEVRYGLELMAVGRRRRELEAWLEERLVPRFVGRTLAVDAEVADQCGKLIATGKKSGHTVDLGDALIAATALVHGLKVVTLNRKHFERLGVDLVTF